MDLVKAEPEHDCEMCGAPATWCDLDSKHDAPFYCDGCATIYCGGISVAHG